MQLKGLVKFFTVALILISLYQLSFTYLVHNVESKAKEKAKKQVRANHPEAQGAAFDALVDTRFEQITDSLQGETVISIPLLKKYTYQAAKEQELNLGLDLQGGMNVTLEVSLDELVRSMSNNPKDPALNKAIADADLAKANSQADFVTLFGEAFAKANPTAKLAYLFTKPSEKEITLSSTNDQVLAKVREEAKSAIERTYKVLLTRIDKFGVVNPNMNLDKNKGIITVELAGVRNPERVRNYLQATANLEFYIVSVDKDLPTSFRSADNALKLYLSGAKVDTTTAVATDSSIATTATTTAKDTGSLSSLVAGNTATTTGDTAKSNDPSKNNPLLALLSAQPDKDSYDPAAIGYVNKKDINKLFEYLNLDVVKNKMPRNVKFALVLKIKISVTLMLCLLFMR